MPGSVSSARGVRERLPDGSVDVAVLLHQIAGGRRREGDDFRSFGGDDRGGSAVAEVPSPIDRGDVAEMVARPNMLTSRSPTRTDSRPEMTT
jgi:hypothetical protein